MARTDGDTWDPATGVGTTATLVATARALATRAGLINDPFAEPLVNAVGMDFFAKVATGELALSDLGDNNGLALLTDLFAVRTRFFDAFLTDACRAGALDLVSMWGHPDQTEGPKAFAEKREAEWVDPASSASNDGH